MTRDEEVYPDPESFKPERFLKNGTLNKEIRDPRDIIFGFGRRYVCLRFHSIVLIVLFSVTLESVLAATWLTAPSGSQSPLFWLHLKLPNPMKLCRLKTGGTLVQVQLSCTFRGTSRLFCLSDAEDDIGIQFPSNAALSLARGRPLT
jgi:hypothetical protein